MFILVVIAILILACVMMFVYGAGHNRDWERENREQEAALEGDGK